MEHLSGNHSRMWHHHPISNGYPFGYPSRVGLWPYPLILEWLTGVKYSNLVDLAKFPGSFHVFKQGVDYSNRDDEKKSLLYFCQITVTPENQADFEKLRNTFVLSEKAKKFMIAQKLLEADTNFIQMADVV